MIYQVIFVMICFILDFLLGYFFPIDYAARSLVFIPSLGFSALILVAKKRTLLDATILVLFSGFIYGLFILDTLFVYPILFTVVMLLTRFWANNVNDTVSELGILCVASIVIKDYLLYVFMFDQNLIRMNLVQWMSDYLFLSVFYNALFVVVVIYFYRHINKLETLIYQRKQKKERVNWR